MAKSEARRQKQLAKKKAKREDRRQHVARLSVDDPAILLAKAEAWPIHEALVPEELWDRGIGHLSISRRCPDGRLACGFFLVDAWCLGVKDAHWAIKNGSDYESMVRTAENAGGLYRTVSPEYFAKLIYAAVDYAKSLGLAPNPDYGHARLLLAGIDPSLCADVFEFGHEGKPYFVQGPHDSDEKVRSVLHRLRAVAGNSVIGAKANVDAEPNA